MCRNRNLVMVLGFAAVAWLTPLGTLVAADPNPAPTPQEIETVFQQLRTSIPPLAKSTWLKWPLGIGSVGLVASYLFFAIYIIDPGHIGVPVWFGNVQHNAYDEGIKIINPMANIEVMDGRRFAFEFTGENALVSVSKKQNPLTVEVAFPLNLN